MKVLFIGDIFGEPGIQTIEKILPELIKKHKIDFTAVQGENVSGRKGLVKKDYIRLKKAGVKAFTMGNHVWAKRDVDKLFANNDIIRPFNVGNYPGQGSLVFEVGNKTLRITSLLGISFNELWAPWKESFANNFFDAIDDVIEINKADYHIVDFHAETTSEKYVLGIYLDELKNKVNAMVGTHTHVQTADEKTLKNGMAYITDIGMAGPRDSAIGADYQSVYKKMRYNEMSRFEVSTNKCQFNAVILDLSPKENKIQRVNFLVD